MAYHGSRQTRLKTHLDQGGFETVSTGTEENPFVAMAVDAMAVAERVDCIVLVPGSPQLSPLATTLRARGVRVETAGFNDPGDAKMEAQSHTVLGPEASFKV
jgi:ABC-type branched-subunit amino acid transport system substrate-binding protein